MHRLLTLGQSHDMPTLATAPSFMSPKVKSLIEVLDGRSVSSSQKPKDAQANLFAPAPIGLQATTNDPKVVSCSPHMKKRPDVADDPALMVVIPGVALRASSEESHQMPV
jgi:hypothetical protein